MKARVLMIQGTSSGAGKSTIVIALCRIFSNLGYKVSPFKAQNMSSKIYSISNTYKISQIQAIQSFASRQIPNWKVNPILLVPIGNDKSRIFIKGKFYQEMSARKYYSEFVLQKGFPIVLDTLTKLREKNDIIVIEGAGSPAEINIAQYDIANMLLAEQVNSPVILVSDIERGGCFASIYGTIKLLKQNQQRLTKGFIINKFRGDETILKDAIRFIEYKTKTVNVGVIPKIEFSLPPEDSLDEINRDYLKDTEISYSNRQLESQMNLLTLRIESRLNLEFILKILKLK